MIKKINHKQTMIRNNDNDLCRKSQCTTWLLSPSAFDPNGKENLNQGAVAVRGGSRLPDALRDVSGYDRA